MLGRRPLAAVCFSPATFLLVLKGMKKTTCLKELQEQVTAHRDARDWKQFHNPKDLAISLQLEATEVLEHFTWKNGETLEKYVQEHKHEIGEELSDVLNSTLLLVDALDIDIAEQFQAKMKKNAEKYPVEKAKGRADKYTEYQ